MLRCSEYRLLLLLVGETSWLTTGVSAFKLVFAVVVLKLVTVAVVLELLVAVELKLVEAVVVEVVLELLVAVALKLVATGVCL